MSPTDRLSSNRQRQGKAKGTAVSGLAFDRDVAAVAFQNGAHDGQTEARTLRFGGEKWLEDARQQVLWNSVAAVGHDYFGVGFTILTRFDRQLSTFGPTVGQSVDTVHRQIEQYLFQMHP